jgi:AAA domain
MPLTPEEIRRAFDEVDAAERRGSRFRVVGRRDNHEQNNGRVSDSGMPLDGPWHTDSGQPPDEQLPYVDLTLALVPREWLVPERIPGRNVSLLGGEGAIGKSLLLMQLSGAVVLGKDWIGTLPEPGSVLYASCEEEGDEIRRRIEDVARHLGSSRQDMVDHGLHFLSFAGKDAILAQPDRNGIMRPTPLFERAT